MGWDVTCKHADKEGCAGILLSVFYMNFGVG